MLIEIKENEFINIDQITRTMPDRITKTVKIYFVNSKGMADQYSITQVDFDGLMTLGQSRIVRLKK